MNKAENVCFVRPNTTCDHYVVFGYCCNSVLYSNFMRYGYRLFSPVAQLEAWHLYCIVINFAISYQKAQKLNAFPMPVILSMRKLATNLLDFLSLLSFLSRALYNY